MENLEIATGVDSFVIESNIAATFSSNGKLYYSWFSLPNDCDKC